ncbi:MAG TPA: hypothetical protein VGS20_05890 [Candidatus Acidoferrales bacterium]|nr:hypothetical protein [Candidatus Acidoferrales bacterium]
MRVPASDVGSGAWKGQLAWLHVGLRLEADRLDEAQLLAAIAERGARAVVEHCAGGDGLHLRLRLEPTDPVSLQASEEFAAAAVSVSPSDVHRPRLENGNSARVRHIDPNDPGDVTALMTLAAGVLPFVQSNEPPPEWLWQATDPAFFYEDEDGTPRLALARSQSAFSTLADLAWLRSLDSPARVEAFRVLLEAAAARGASKPITAMPVIIPAALLSFAADLRSAGVIGGPICELSVAAVLGGKVERVS